MFGKYFGRFVATVLLVAVFSCTLFSCKSAGDESSSPASDASGSTVEVDAYRDENGNYKAALPDKDWGCLLYTSCFAAKVYFEWNCHTIYPVSFPIPFL